MLHYITDHTERTRGRTKRVRDIILSPIHLSRSFIGERRAIYALALALAVCLAGCGGCHFGKPSPPAATYEEKLSAFTIGTIALETADKNLHDVKYLTLASQIAPEEPAVWANLGLMNLRAVKNDEAARDLAKAEQMAPDSAAIQKLIGLLDSTKGDVPGAIQHYQRAVDLAPDDLRARYALGVQLGRNDDLAGNRKQLEAILQRAPYNVLAQIELARITATQGDSAGLKRAIGMLEPRSSTFPPQAHAQFAVLKTAAKGPNPRAARVPTVILSHCLEQDASYHRSYVDLIGEGDTANDEPLMRFIKLPNPPATPAAPDTALTFTALPLSDMIAGAKWAGIAWLDTDKGYHDIPPDKAPQKIITLTSDGRTVRLAGGKTLVFPGAGVPPGPHGVLPLDVNYDLLTDFALAGRGGIKLYLGGKDGGYTDATAAMKLPASVLGAAYVGVWQADIEADGDLDIVAAPVSGPPIVLRNNGDGTFKAITPFVGVTDARDFAWADIENSGNPAAAFVDAHGALKIYSNQRSGLFKLRPVPPGVGQVAALTVGDVTSDGRLSLIALQTDGKLVRISDVNGGESWEVATLAQWASPPKDIAPGVARLYAADLDNNGGLDLIASTSSAAQVWLSDDKYSYVSLPSPLPGPVFGAMDLNGDGRIDLVGLDAQGKPIQMINTGKLSYNWGAYHWDEIRPRAVGTEFNPTNDQQGNAGGDRRINSFGIGGTMEARSGLLYQKQSIAGPTVHFGLGTNRALDAIRIVWPNGDVRAEFGDEIAVDKSVDRPHRLKGSCPFLFAWDGKQFRFVTDCIWRSPLGLRINAQDTAGSTQTEDWLKISGEQLAPRDGHYDLSVTAELWETHYFDHLSLLTVDHPANTEIWVDERFARTPPHQKLHTDPHTGAITAEGIYVTTPLHAIKEAVDDRGHDVTEILKERDGRHLDTFGRGLYQGITRDHWVEIALPDDAPKTGPLWLVCQGWVHPTDSSINVALGQSHYPPPQGLSLETPDARGRWSVARPGLGFPEGKVKTILLNLDGVFKPGAPRRLRLRTNLEVYWDAIRWAAGLPQTQPKIAHLSARTAELRYRGFSVVKAADSSSPELPQSYDDLETTVEKWRDLEGYYTRYGDVKELLAAVDDRYVIMNAGDEMLLTFAAPSAPLAGSKRDFVVIADGWEKDGDYNTAFSKTVLPLPSHARIEYNVPPKRLEDDPVYQQHRRDWETYHTRYVAPDRFARGLNPNP